MHHNSHCINVASRKLQIAIIPTRFGILTGQTDFVKMNAIWNNHEGADALWHGLFSCQVASGLFIFRLGAEGSYACSWLEIDGVAGPHKTVTRAVAQTQVLAFFKHPKWWCRVTYLCNTNYADQIPVSSKNKHCSESLINTHNVVIESVQLLIW